MDPEQAKLGITALILLASYGALLLQKTYRSEARRKR
jgi:hypothetical protein